MDASNGEGVSSPPSPCWIVQVRWLAIKQLLCHMLRGGVLYDKQSINLLLIAYLMECALRLTTNVYTNNLPEQDCSLIPGN